MKKYIIIANLAIGALTYGQINIQSNPNPTINQENPFLDASSYNNFKNNVGKGLYFPSTDLTTWEFKTDLINPGKFKNYFDGMIVYNTGEGDPTTDANVGGIRKNLTRGFYYFKNPNQTFPGGSIENGEWVRISDAQANANLWYKKENGDIALKTPDTSSDNVFYRKDGGYEEVVKPGNKEQSTSYFDNSSGQYLPLGGGFNPSAPFVYRKIKQQSHNLVPPAGFTGNQKHFNNIHFEIDKADTFAGNSFYINQYKGNVSPQNENSYEQIILHRNGLKHEGSGLVKYLRSQYNTLTITPNSSAFQAELNFNLLENFSSNPSQYNLITVSRFRPRGTGEINYVSLTRNWADLQYPSSSNINFFHLTEDRLEVNDDYTGTIDRLYGYRQIFKNTGSSKPNVNKMYGLYLSSVNWGKEENYAIYTNKGINRFGDDIKLSISEDDTYSSTIGKALSSGAGLSFKANAKVDAATLPINFIDFDFNNSVDNTQRGIVRFFRGTNLEGTKSLEVYKGNQSTDMVAKLAVGGNSFVANEQGFNFGVGTVNPTEKLEVAGAVKAESFKGTNGATIFPDYVFENYYTGTSTTKADYSFKNLNQVESFVKTNGHLPGYQSAKEVKAQGYIDIIDTQLTNVEKIEELYLHTIEQDKAIQAKEAKIAELEAELATQKERLDKLEKLLVQ